MRLIDADAMKKKVWPTANYSGSEIISVLNDEEITPTIDAEPVVRAHWEILRCVGGRAFWGCSRCRTAVSAISPTWPYCPYCGARMGEEVDDG